MFYKDASVEIQTPLVVVDLFSVKCRVYKEWCRLVKLTGSDNQYQVRDARNFTAIELEYFNLIENMRSIIHIGCALYKYGKAYHNNKAGRNPWI
jgi:hypothetical protein